MSAGEYDEFMDALFEGLLHGKIEVPGPPDLTITWPGADHVHSDFTDPGQPWADPASDPVADIEALIERYREEPEQ